jgi:hypothetical protein
MRSGLLAAGLILLVLGAVFWMFPISGTAPTQTTGWTTTQTTPGEQQTVDTSYRTTTSNVTTTKYAPGDNTTNVTTTGGTTDEDTTYVLFPSRTTETTTTTDVDRNVVAQPSTQTTNTGYFSSTSTAFTNAPMQRQLAVLAMILGAILTILGLVLPSSHVHVTTARTSAPAARRVRVEEEEHEHRRY